MQVNTRGGSYISGSISCNEFVGGDKIVRGDYVDGDKVGNLNHKKEEVQTSSFFSFWVKHGENYIGSNTSGIVIIIEPCSEFDGYNYNYRLNFGDLLIASGIAPTLDMAKELSDAICKITQK